MDLKLVKNYNLIYYFENLLLVKMSQLEKNR